MPNLRPQLARHLRQRLQAFSEGFRHNLALIGPPGSGKTYQLDSLLQDAPPNLLIVSCRLYRESCQSFLQRLLSTILLAGLPQALLAREVGEGAGRSHQPPLDALLSLAERELPRTAAAARQAEGLLLKRAHSEAFTRTLDAIPTLGEERGKPCVVILDEFLYLEDLGLVHAFRELGKRVMTWPSALFILTSSSPYRARTILRERLQLLFGHFELMELDAVDHQAALLWIHRDLKGLRGVDALAPFLSQWLAPSPRHMSAFLTRLKERAVLGRQPELTEGLFLETAWDLIGAPDGVLSQSCAARLEEAVRERAGRRAVDALIQIAEGARTATEIGARIGRGGLGEALQLLLEHDLAQRNGTCWLLTDPVLRCWASAVLAAQRAGGAGRPADLRQRVEGYLRAAWMRWTHQTQLSHPDEVVRLFSRFRDETVSLDSRIGRLPRFDRIAAHQPPVTGTAAYLVADGPGRRWCAAVLTGVPDDTAIAGFDAFCRQQAPKPSRKVLIMPSGMDEHTRILAKAAKMWVWEPEDLQVLRQLYGTP